jgi:site-specific DNA-methyltransferase (adenine-specific)
MESKEGSFRLLLGNALEVLPSIPSKSVDFVFADPPYFLSNDGLSIKSGKAASVNKGAWDKSAGFDSDVEFHKSWISEVLRILKPNGSVVVSGTYHSIFQCGYLLQQFGCRIVNEIVWYKPNGAPSLAGRNFTASHESLIWATQGKAAKHTFNYQLSKNWESPKDKLLNPGRQMRSVWSIATTPPSEKKLGHHPTQKPIELLRRLIAICTREGDTVLDPFCGSGTTGVAAVSAGREFIGIEINDEFLELSRKRIEEAAKSLSDET